MMKSLMKLVIRILEFLGIKLLNILKNINDLLMLNITPFISFLINLVKIKRLNNCRNELIFKRL